VDNHVILIHNVHVIVHVMDIHHVHVIVSVTVMFNVRVITHVMDLDVLVMVHVILLRVGVIKVAIYIL